MCIRDRARHRLLLAAGNDTTHPEDQAQAVKEITSASDSDLEQAIHDSLTSCKAGYGGDLPTHIKFVWESDGGLYWPRLWDDKVNKNISGIRKLFSAAEAHNPRLRNLLNCYSASEILSLMEAVPQPPPKVRGDVAEKLHPTHERNAGADHGRN